MLLSDLLTTTLNKMPPGKPVAVDFLTAVNAVTRTIGQALLHWRDDLSRQTVTVTVAAGSGQGHIRAVPMGLTELPCDVADETVLRPVALPEQRTTRPGVPLWFEVTGSALKVYPPTTKSRAYRVGYYGLPAPAEGMDEETPYDGHFDAIYLDALPLVVLNGAVGSHADEVRIQTENIIMSRRLLAEQLQADAINRG